MPALRQLDGCLFSAGVMVGRKNPRAPRACAGDNRAPEYRQAPDRRVCSILQFKSPASRCVDVGDRMTIEIENPSADCDHGHEVLLCASCELCIRETFAA